MSDMWKYRDRTCQCGSTFRPTSETQTECTQCMIKPRASGPHAQRKSRGVTNKVRRCEHPGCSESYIPSGNRQRFCPKHVTKPSRGKGRKKPPSKQKPPRSVVPANAVDSKTTAPSNPPTITPTACQPSALASAAQAIMRTMVEMGMVSAEFEYYGNTFLIQRDKRDDDLDNGN